MIFDQGSQRWQVAADHLPDDLFFHSPIEQVLEGGFSSDGFFGSDMLSSTLGLQSVQQVPRLAWESVLEWVLRTSPAERVEIETAAIPANLPPKKYHSPGLSPL